MRMSCNGCRVLRKGCSDDCALRHCLDWIKTPESQANATLFLAKFYGRVGLLNLINAGPNHLRPVIFKSLLYEACGRIVNPVYGSVGLLRTKNWDTCQSAVDSVLSGSTVMQSSTHDAAEAALHGPIIPLEGCDIHYVSNKTPVGQSQKRVKHRGKARSDPVTELETSPMTRFTISGWKEMNTTQSHDSLSFSVETVGASLSNLVGLCRVVMPELETAEPTEIGLELSLGLNIA